MDAASAVANAESVQRAFRVIGALMLTAYLFPRQAIVKDFDEFDFIIVGGGSAGSVIADRLSEVPELNVLVIEAGDIPPYESFVPSLFSYLTHSKYDWNFTSPIKDNIGKGLKTDFYNITCARVLGGGSSINYMYYVRGCPEDYNAWARAVGDDTWCYSGVLSYLIKSERLESDEILSSPYRNYHGTDGFLGVTREKRPITNKYLQAFGELGNNVLLDVNGDQCLGYTRPLYTLANGMRQTTAYTNIGINKERTNLHVLTKTFVKQILIDENNNAVGVRAVTDDNKIITIKARQEVIVSAGAINTPKLLMLSGVGPQKHLESMKIKVKSNLPVGLNLKDHHYVILAIQMEKSESVTPPSSPFEYPTPGVTGYVTLDSFKTSADYQAINFLISNDSKDILQSCSFNNGYKDYICQNLYNATKGRNMMFTILGFLQPKSKGHVMLRSSNAEDSPVIETGILSDKRDLEDFTSYIVDFVRVVNTTYFRSMNSELVNLKVRECEELKFGSREYWRCYVLSMTSTMIHYSGTAPMGSVVDSRLRVSGVSRLRVADASVMPSLVGGNINAAVIMIAEKLADIVKQEYCSNGLYNTNFNWNYFY